MKRATYAEQILATVSQELMTEFGKGFDISNLGYMRQSCRTCADDQKVSPLVTQLPRMHDLIIRGQTKRELKQKFRQALFE